VAAVRFNYATAFRFCVFFNNASRFAEEHTGFDDFDGFIEAFSGCFDDADGITVCKSFLSDIVGFVEVAVEATMVEADVEIDDVAVEEDTLIRNAMTDNFVDGGAEGFGEVDVV